MESIGLLVTTTFDEFSVVFESNKVVCSRVVYRALVAVGSIPDLETHSSGVVVVVVLCGTTVESAEIFLLFAVEKLAWVRFQLKSSQKKLILMFSA